MNRRQVLVGAGALVAVGTGATAVNLRQMGTMEEYDAAVAKTRAALSAQPQITEFIRFATLAANGHNTQPWRFRAHESGINILPDFTRRTPAVDPDDHHLFASLGCAAENLAIAAAANGRSGAVSFNPANDGSVDLAFGGTPHLLTGLVNAIPQRQSTRSIYDGRPVSIIDLRTLAAAAAVPGIDLVLITDRPHIERVRDLIVAGNTAQMADAAFMRELKSWLRFNPREALATSDGLFSATSGNPTVPSWFGPLMFDWFFRTQAENDKYASHLQSSAGLAVFAADKADREHWVLAGQACQRFALQATALGLKHAFVNQPVEVARLRPELAAIVGLPGRRPDIVMRFGYAPKLPFSARRPVAAVLS